MSLIWNIPMFFIDVKKEQVRKSDTEIFVYVCFLCKLSTFSIVIMYVDRHWKDLMTKTGQTFEMNPDTFTLANVFAMELHRFQVCMFFVRCKT